MTESAKVTTALDMIRGEVAYLRAEHPGIPWAQTVAKRLERYVDEAEATSWIDDDMVARGAVYIAERFPGVKYPDLVARMCLSAALEPSAPTRIPPAQFPRILAEAAKVAPRRELPLEVRRKAARRLEAAVRSTRERFWDSQRAKGRDAGELGLWLEDVAEYFDELAAESKWYHRIRGAAGLVAGLVRALR